MYNLIILTPTLCRIDIHNIVMPNIIKMILGSTLVDEIRYFINIDNVSGIKKYLQEETKGNFLKYFANTKIISEFNLSQKPCFFTAVKTLIEMALPYINENSIIFYLEDDWYLSDIFVDNKFDEIIQTQFTLISYISLTKMSIGKKNNLKLPYAFKPVLWGFDLFNKIFKTAIMQSTKIFDPEYVVELYAKTTSDKIEYNLYSHKMFNDIGRAWQSENKLVKWNHKDTNIKTEITYIAK